MTTVTTAFGISKENNASLAWWFPWLDVPLQAPPFTADTKTFTLSSSAAFLDVMPASLRSIQLVSPDTILRYSEGVDVLPAQFNLSGNLTFIERDRYYVAPVTISLRGPTAIFRTSKLSAIGGGSPFGGSFSGGGWRGVGRSVGGSSGSSGGGANTDPARSRKYAYAQNADSLHTIGPWPTGINNRLSDNAMPVTAVRDAVNTTLDTAGFFRRRSGYTRVAPGVGMRAGFSCAAGAYVLRGSELCRFETDGTVTPLVGGISGPTPAYAYFNGAVYFTDGITSLVIEQDVVRPWGLPVPPTMPANIDFSFAEAGTYLVAQTTVDSAGRESGASSVHVETVLSTGSGEPVVTPRAGVNTYVSPVNSSTLYLNGYGAELATKDIGPAPAGQALTVYRGRMYVASGACLWVSEPFAPDWFHKIRGFIQFPEPISICLAVDQGVFVVSDQAYFLRGSGPEDFVLEPGLPYRGVQGTGMAVPFTQDVMWFSDRGLIVGSSKGDMQNIQEQNVATHLATKGAICLQERGGQRHAVVSLHMADQ